MGMNAPLIHDSYLPVTKTVSWKNVDKQITYTSIIISIFLVLIGLFFR